MDAFALLSRSTNLRQKRGRALATTPPSAVPSSQPHESPKNSTDPANKTSQAPGLPTEDKCRAILREHKLKVTALWQPDLEETSHTSRIDKKKRKRSSETGANEVSSTKRRKADIVPVPLTSFNELRTTYGISNALAANLEAQGYKTPTEVQMASIPLLMGDKSIRNIAGPSAEVLDSKPTCDLLAVAPTGSGKTLAFLVPLLEGIIHRHRTRKATSAAGKPDTSNNGGPLALVIAPTKELARQIVNEGRKFALKTGIKVSLVRKGMRIHDKEATVSSDDDSSEQGEAQHTQASVVKAEVLVSTPLALLHAARPSEDQPADLATVENLVLDEADVLLDPLFRQQTTDIWSACTNPALRVSLWSATMGSNIEEIAASMIKNRRLSSDATISTPLIRLIVGLKDSSIPNIDHKLVYAATEQGKLMGMRRLLRAPDSAITTETPLRPPFLVFTQTIPRATALYSELLYDIPAEAGGKSRIAVLHSDLSEAARDLVMTRLRKGEIWVLITTDLLARGVDFRGINGVVNYDLPTSSAAYVHRVGRTGRAGREGGVAVTLYAKEDLPFVKNIANVIAASKRQGGGAEAREETDRWLLDSLPKPSKRDKKMLKQRGVESRRTNKFRGPSGEYKNTKTQISTKSGYDRRLENRRKAAVQHSKSGQVAVDKQEPIANVEDADFGGFDD